MNPLYTAEANATGDGRDGRVRSNDGILDAALATPKELGGAGGATNPEQLFAAGYAACFHSALRLAARRARVELTDSTVNAQVDLGRAETGGYGLAVRLAVALPAVPQAVAEELVNRAHQVCPYSNAVRGNVSVALTVDGQR